MGEGPNKLTDGVRALATEKGDDGLRAGADRPSGLLTPAEIAILEVPMERIRQKRRLAEKVYRRGPPSTVPEKLDSLRVKARAHWAAAPRELQLRPVGELLGSALLNLKSASALESTWRRVVGDLLARHSRPLRWDDSGTSLVVGCDTEDWRRVLSQERVELARKLSTELRSEVAALVFVAEMLRKNPPENHED